MFTKYQRDRFCVFVLISFPQMSNILLQKSLPLAQPQISNKIMFPYYPYVVLYTEECTYKGNSLAHDPALCTL